MSNLRIFIEFAGHFVPILGDSGTHHVFAVPVNCSTVNDVAYEIINKYDLQSLAPDGVELKIQNKYILMARDHIKNTLREGDQIHVSPRVIPTNWNHKPHKRSSRKRKKPNDVQITDDQVLHNDESIIKTPPHKKRKLNQCIPASVVSNASSSSSSSSVTEYSSSDSDHDHNNNNIHKLDDIREEDINTNNIECMDVMNNNETDTDTLNVKGSNEASSTDSSSSDSTSDNEDIIDKIINNNAVLDDNIQRNNDTEHNDNDDTSISTLNDALQMLKNHKKALNEKNNGYLRSIKAEDRIKILIDNDWRNGTVLDANNGNNVELCMDNREIMNVSLDETQWDFEPENFSPPRLLKKISNHNGYCNDDIEEEDIKERIEECGHQRIRNKELKCDEMIAYKVLELVDWEPMYSKYKMGIIVEIKDGIVIMKNNKGKQSVAISDLCEIYKVNVMDTVQSLKELKDRRKVRKQKQKDRKDARRCSSM